MQLSKRLQTVAEMVHSEGTVADIGCDHGFTSIYLIQKGLAKRVIAMDINKGPLERAKEHIRQYALQEQIGLRLSDGAKKLEPGEADTLLISGMGGALICKILQESETVVKAASELVLSPQSEIHLVRRLLHGMGFQIAEEEMVQEQGKYYVIIRGIPGEEGYTEEADYLYGKKLIDKRNPVLYQFLEKERTRVGQVLDGMKGKSLSESGLEKREELQQERERIQRVLNKMSRKSE